MWISALLSIVLLLGLFMLAWRFLSERYSIPCPAWLAWLVELDNPLTKINRAASIVEHLELQPGMNVVDIGCGPGRVSIPLAQKVGPQGKVVALDIQEAMLEKTREKARAAGLSNITFLEAGIGDGKLEPNAYDRAVLVTVLGEIPAQERALKEIFNALKPGGILSITEIIFDPHYQRIGTALHLAQDVGFLEKQRFEDSFAYTINLEKPKA